MATISELMERAAPGRLCSPKAFRFAEPNKPCEHWASGEHIVLNGLCRCGKQFNLIEKEQEQTNVETNAVC